MTNILRCLNIQSKSSTIFFEKKTFLHGFYFPSIKSTFMLNKNLNLLLFVYQSNDDKPISITLSTLQRNTEAYANSADPDETAHNDKKQQEMLIPCHHHVQAGKSFQKLTKFAY